MTAGASRAATKITSQPALAPSPQPRPAPTGRALIAQNVGKGGPFRMPIRGPDWMPIDNQDLGTDRLGVVEALESGGIPRKLVVPEVARAHAGRDHQIIERDLADAHARGGRLDRAISKVDARDLRQEHVEV